MKISENLKNKILNAFDNAKDVKDTIYYNSTTTLYEEIIDIIERD